MGELSEDLLFGAARVSEFVGVDTRNVYHWMDRRRNGRDAPPLFDVGGQVCARRSELSSWFSGYRDLSSRGLNAEAAMPPDCVGDGVMTSKTRSHAENLRNPAQNKSDHAEKAGE